MSSLSDDVTGIEKLYEESVQPGSIQPFEKCAVENGFCECQEGAKIVYGAPNWLVYDNHMMLVELTSPEGGFDCTNVIFGDPIPFTKKHCWCKENDQPYEKCAEEGGFCACQKNGVIAYGAPYWVAKIDSRLREKTSPERGLDCTNAIFGDPIYGTKKQCWCSKAASHMAKKMTAKAL